MQVAHLAVVGVICVAVAAGFLGERLSRLQFGFAEPPMTRSEQVGETLYEAGCASCHGAPREGRGLLGPALISGPYGPGAVSYARLARAVRNGTGTMPPIDRLDRTDLEAISNYLVYRAMLP